MNFVVPDFYPAAAEIFVAVMALVIMLASTFARSIARNLSYFLTQATLIAAALITIYTMEGEVVHTFSNMFISDLMGDFLKLMIYFSTAIALLYGRGYLADRKIDMIMGYVLAAQDHPEHEGHDHRCSDRGDPAIGREGGNDVGLAQLQRAVHEGRLERAAALEAQRIGGLHHLVLAGKIVADEAPGHTGAGRDITYRRTFQPVL